MFAQIKYILKKHSIPKTINITYVSQLKMECANLHTYLNGYNIYSNS